MMKILTFLFLNIFSLQTLSSTVAILDNGVDHTHQELTNSIYRSTTETENGNDDDRNGYVDDILGWNFVEMNNKTFDFSREVYLTKKIERYYYLRSRNTLKVITTEETKEYNELKKDAELKKKRSEFVSWMHGTHVAGIAASLKELPIEVSDKNIKLISITYLGDAKSGPAKAPSFKRINSTSLKAQEENIKNYWEKFLRWQLNKFSLGIEYAASKAEVVNGSFGQSFEGIQDRMKSYYKKQFYKEMSEKLSFDRTAIFMKKLIKESSKILKRHPETLFIFSAGNKKNDSDIFIHFPSAIRLNNSLSIGASFEYKEMAYFSNYGKKTVDIFAPGMAIESTIPRQGYLSTNGTSQASPFIANIAVKALALAKNINVVLNIKDLKNILLGTSLKKEELKLKSVSGGIIFPQRVYQAIRELKNSSLQDAINIAVRTHPTKNINDSKIITDGLLLELPTP